MGWRVRPKSRAAGMPPAPSWRRRWGSASASAPSWSSLSWTGSRATSPSSPRSWTEASISSPATTRTTTSSPVTNSLPAYIGLRKEVRHLLGLRVASGKAAVVLARPFLHFNVAIYAARSVASFLDKPISGIFGCGSSRNRAIFCGVKLRHFRNHGKWRRLVGRCAGLDGCHNVTRRTPPLRQPFAIIRIRSKSLKGENNNAQRNAVSEAKHS